MSQIPHPKIPFSLISRQNFIIFPHACNSVLKFFYISLFGNRQIFWKQFNIAMKIIINITDTACI